MKVTIETTGADEEINLDFELIIADKRYEWKDIEDDFKYTLMDCAHKIVKTYWKRSKYQLTPETVKERYAKVLSKARRKAQSK